MESVIKINLMEIIDDETLREDLIDGFDNDCIEYLEYPNKKELFDNFEYICSDYWAENLPEELAPNNESDWTDETYKTHPDHQKLVDLIEKLPESTFIVVWS